MDHTFTFALIYSTLFLIIFTVFFDIRKYKKNMPYIHTKKKRKFFSRILLGIVAGFHHLHFIGTYDHKKYNTQIDPKTLEGYIGIIFSSILWLVYLIIALYFYSLFGVLGLFILLLPIISNLISIIFYGNI